MTRWWNPREVVLCGHASVEIYAVLTRLPGDSRLAPTDAARTSPVGWNGKQRRSWPTSTRSRPIIEPARWSTSARTGSEWCTLTALTNGDSNIFTTTATDPDGTSAASADSTPVRAAVPQHPEDRRDHDADHAGDETHGEQRADDTVEGGDAGKPGRVRGDVSVDHGRLLLGLYRQARSGRSVGKARAPFPPAQTSAPVTLDAPPVTSSHASFRPANGHPDGPATGQVEFGSTMTSTNFLRKSRPPFAVSGRESAP